MEFFRKQMGTLIIALSFATQVSAGAMVIVEPKSGGEIKWQFSDLEEAFDFVQDRREDGKCEKIASLRIITTHIEGMD